MTNLAGMPATDDTIVRRRPSVADSRGPVQVVIEPAAARPVDESHRAERLRRVWLSTTLSRCTVGVGTLVMLLACLEACARTGLIDSVFVPAPSAIFVRFVNLAIDGVLPRHAAASLSIILMGMAVAIVVGIALAVLCSVWRTFDWATHPLVELTRGLAPLALIPLFMIVFGIGTSSKIAITVWVSWVPIFVSTLEGMKSVNPALLKVAKSTGASKLYIAWTVILPSAAPFIVTGIRLGFGAAFLAIVAAEMFGATYGLGFLTLEMSQTFKILDMYAAILAIGVIGWTINGLVLLSLRWLVPWHHHENRT